MTRPPADPNPGVDRRLARYVRRTVYPYSAHYRAALDAAGVGNRVRGRGDLGALPPTDLAQISDPGSLVLRPDLATIVRSGSRGLAARAVASKALGGMHNFNADVIEHRFKPIHWVLGHGVPIGYAPADLQRLASAGAQWLDRAGVGPRDVVASLLPAGPTVAHWQLVLGCRRARVSAIHLDPDTDPLVLERLAPSVLVGDPQHLVSVLAQARAGGHSLANVRTVLAVGDPVGAELRGHLRSLSGGSAVVAAWAPQGVRAMWTECRAGAERPEPLGYHAWDSDVLELAPGASGELLWTGVGWRGSAVLKLRTLTVGRLDYGRCPACGRDGTRVVPLAPIPRDTEWAEGQPGTITARPASEISPTTSWAPPLPASSSSLGASSQSQSPSLPQSPQPSSPQRPSPSAPPDARVEDRPPEMVGAETLLDGESEIAAWQVEYRSVDGQPETIVVLALAWGAALVPLLRRLDRHLHASQFVVVSVDEVIARLEAAGGRRLLGSPPSTFEHSSR